MLIQSKYYRLEKVNNLYKESTHNDYGWFTESVTLDCLYERAVHIANDQAFCEPKKFVKMLDGQWGDDLVNLIDIENKSIENILTLKNVKRDAFYRICYRGCVEGFLNGFDPQTKITALIPFFGSTTIYFDNEESVTVNNILSTVLKRWTH